MEKIVSLGAVRERTGSLAQQAFALMGRSPMMTLHTGESNDDVCCCIRMQAAGAGCWVGIVSDRSVFSDRIRMGMTPSFTVYPHSDVATVCGNATVRLLGRADALGEFAPAVQDAAAQLLREQPFTLRDAVIVEVTPGSVQVVDEDRVALGSVPRT